MFNFFNQKSIIALCLIIIIASLNAATPKKASEVRKENDAKKAVMKQNYQQLQQSYQQNLNSLITKIDLLNAQMQTFNSIQDNLVIDDSAGNIKKLEIQAQRYSTELKARKNYTQKVAEIKQLTENLKEIKFKLSFYDEYYSNLPKDAPKIISAEVAIANNKSEQYKKQTPIDLTKASTFEVKTPAPLKTISALPEVYNDATLWEKIYEANKHLIKDPKGVIPAGTLLKIPHIDKIKNFKNIK
ncbi:hypothetical protein AAEX28_14880 [Lentisphaerota bacterium WC36G]|nr:hypothetical protein LJT99_01635 [Lentisphaerae bacterium WC36]